MRTVEEIYLDVILGNYEASNYKLLEYDLEQIKVLIEELTEEVNELTKTLRELTDDK